MVTALAICKTLCVWSAAPAYQKEAPFAGQPSLDRPKVKVFGAELTRFEANNVAKNQRATLTESSFTRKLLCPQDIPVHFAAIEMEKRHFGVMAKWAFCEAPFEFVQHDSGHGMEIGERL